MFRLILSFLQILTWLDAVHDSEEGVSVPPALSEVADLDAKLLGDLSLAPHEQRLPGSDLPLLLNGDSSGLVAGASGGASRSRAIILAVSAVAGYAGAAVALAKLLQNSGVLFNLED